MSQWASYATSMCKSGTSPVARTELIVLCSDKKCEEPLGIGMEDPGSCSFSEVEIGNQAVSVHCYDDTAREDI